MDYNRAVRAVKAAAEMSYREAGATDEQSFELGKTVGVHLTVNHLESISFS